MAAPSQDEQQSISHEEAVRDLRAACRAKDLSRVRELFKTNILGALDATKELKKINVEVPLMRCLLENGADPNVLGLDGADSLEELKLLAEFGYDFRPRGHLVLQHFVDSRETLDWLLDQGVDINKTKFSETDSGRHLAGPCDYSLKVLNGAAARGDIELFDHLVSRGADPSRSFALHRASGCKDPQRSTAMISHLIDKHHMNVDADTDALTDFLDTPPGYGTPLECAIYNKNLPAVQELLERGAKPERAAYFAIGGRYLEKGYLPALAPLLNAGADSTAALGSAVYAAVYPGNVNVEAAKICLDCGADPVRALEWVQARIDEVASWKDVDSDEDVDHQQESEVEKEKVMFEMERVLKDWERVGGNA